MLCRSSHRLHLIQCRACFKLQVRACVSDACPDPLSDCRALSPTNIDHRASFTITNSRAPRIGSDLYLASALRDRGHARSVVFLRKTHSPQSLCRWWRSSCWRPPRASPRHWANQRATSHAPTSSELECVTTGCKARRGDDSLLSSSLLLLARFAVLRRLMIMEVAGTCLHRHDTS